MSQQTAINLHSLLASAQANSAAAPGLKASPDLPASGAAQISSLAYDSRHVKPGALYFCVPGFNVDGHDFAAQALAAGAAAFVTERPLHSGAIEILVPSVRAAMGPIASAFYGDPSRHLELVGVTGTNGKTTTAMLVRALEEALGGSCGLLGTVQSIIGGAAAPAQRTTPEAIDLQAQLRAMVDCGDRACAIEVSSHALALHRSDGCSFAGAIFTNLTQDHLDFHADMEHYFAAKRRLFASPVGRSVVNVGDPYGARLAGELPAAVTYAIEGEAAGADFFARQIRCSGLLSEFTLDHPSGSERVTLAMAGRYNIANALGALAVVAAGDRPIAALLERLAAGVQVPGRLEPVDCGQDFSVLVDYAHTPDSLERVLRAARELLGDGCRLHCVFGAGGDRDRAKRPLMGQAAAGIADRVIVTSDNPRSEPPEAIIAEVLAGARGAGAHAQVSSTADRREAIALALAEAKPGDVVIIAGKGHEHGQEFAAGRILPFDDAQVARALLRALGHASDDELLPLGERAGAAQLSAAAANDAAGRSLGGV